jgi:hypothetical protein
MGPSFPVSQERFRKFRQYVEAEVRAGVYFPESGFLGCSYLASRNSVILPSFKSFETRFLFEADHLLLSFLGVNFL